MICHHVQQHYKRPIIITVVLQNVNLNDLINLNTSKEEGQEKKGASKVNFCTVTYHQQIHRSNGAESTKGKCTSCKQTYFTYIYVHTYTIYTMHYFHVTGIIALLYFLTFIIYIVVSIYSFTQKLFLWFLLALSVQLQKK